MKFAAKSIRFLSGLIDKIVFLIFVMMFLFGAYALLDTILLYNEATDKTLLNYKPEYALKEEEERPIRDMIGWITIENTKIDYPIMQGITNDEYVNKDPYGEYSLSGSIFLDSRNKSDFSDKYNMIYGHHMDHGAMFGALDSFADEKYFQEHKVGKIIAEEKIYRIHFFSFFIVSAEEDAVFDIENVDRTLDFIKRNHKIYEEPETNHLVALSTCKTPESIERTVLVGYLTDEGDTEDAE